MNGRHDGNDDEEQPEHGVTAPAHSTGAPSHPDADDGDKVKAAAETQQPDSSESVAAETLKRVRVTEIAMVILTAVIAFSGLLTAWVYWHQLDVMQDTLDEIRVSGIDTHHLSSAMGRSAVAMRGLVEQTTTLAEQTTSLATYAGKAAVAVEKSQAATEKLARATADAAAASHSLAESAGQSTAATQRLASAANDANTGSRELVKTTQQVGEINQNAQRAFVFVKGISLQKVTYAEWYRALVESKGLTEAIAPIPANLPAPLQTMGWQANITWENSGSTPTKNLTVSNNFWVSDLYREAKNPIIDVSAISPDDKFLVKHPDQKVFIGPKQSAQVPVTFFEPLSMVLTSLFLPRYYVFGTATYQDILNPSYIHRVDYCFLIHLTGDFRSGLPGNSKGFEPFGADLVPCAKHNCMDEECNQKPPQPITPPEPAKPPG